MPMLQVVVAVDHRVLGVVGDDPEEVDREQHPRERRHVAAAPRRTPSGCRTQNAMPEERLRQGEEALEERIDDRDRRPRERQSDRRRGWSTRTSRNAQNASTAASHERLATAAISPAASGRPRVRSTCASKRAVGPVVDRAAGRAHQQRCPTTKIDSSARLRPARARDPQRRQRRPQQQQDADRLVEPHQPLVGVEARGERSQRVPAAGGGARHGAR